MENVGIIDKSVFIELFQKVAEYGNHVENINKTLFEAITRKNGFIFRKPCTYGEHYRWKYDGWGSRYMVVSAAFKDGVINKEDYDVWMLDDLANDLWREIGSLLEDDVKSLYIKHDTAKTLRRVQGRLKELENFQCE